MSNPATREYEKVICYISQLIESGAIKCGDRLPTERALSASLGIGRNSIREALRIMDNMGLTVSRQGSGNYLADNMGLSLARVIDVMLLTQRLTPQEVCNFRRHMEETVCNMILENPQRQQILSEIPDILSRFQNASAATRVELDRRFHYALVTATGNQMMIFLMQGVMNVYRRWIDGGLKYAGEDELQILHGAHSELYDGLIDNDHAKIHSALRLHYSLVDRLNVNAINAENTECRTVDDMAALQNITYENKVEPAVGVEPTT